MSDEDMLLYVALDLASLLSALVCCGYSMIVSCNNIMHIHFLSLYISPPVKYFVPARSLVFIALVLTCTLVNTELSFSFKLYLAL